MAVLFRIFFMTILSLSALMMVSLIFSSFNGKVDYFTENLKKLKAVISDMIDELIPVDIHEIKILSWKTQPKKKHSILRGYLSTIFQEKMIAYAIEEVNEQEVILHAETTKQAYTLHKEGRNTKVFLSDKLLGTITEYKGFYELETKADFFKAINLGSDCFSIREKDKEIADIVLGNDDYSNDRLFKMIHKSEFVENDSFVAFLLYLLLLKS